MKPISSWGRLNANLHQEIYLNDPEGASSSISQFTPGIAYGNGRSYGDVCLNKNGNLWLTTRLNRFIDFNQENGVITCEAGVLLKDIQDLTIPRGWMLPVTPGTQLITLGGAIANDIHGKNHHVNGAFGGHVLSIKLARTDGQILSCSPHQNADFLFATIGGIGLTGVIIQASIQLKKVSGPWLDTETMPYYNLSDFFELADKSESEWEYTVSWIDCLSKNGLKGIFMRGNHAELKGPTKLNKKSKKIKVPFTPPISLINHFSLKPFNKVYFELNRLNSGSKVVHYEPFFYPLDNILEWNKIYGRKGFFQYQCLIPVKYRFDAINSILKEISRSGEGSFLTVLKTFGNKEPSGIMSFSSPGVTLALDFPNNGEKILSLLSRLDSILLEADGKVYLAKDARMSREFFQTSYPRLQEFLKYRDPLITSELSRRLIGS
jgi:FAD/FMN-containing dehydrogenase